MATSEEKMTDFEFKPPESRSKYVEHKVAAPVIDRRHTNSHYDREFDEQD